MNKFMKTKRMLGIGVALGSFGSLSVILEPVVSLTNMGKHFLKIIFEVVMKYLKYFILFIFIKCLTSYTVTGANCAVCLEDSVTVTQVIEKYINSCGGSVLKDVKTEIRIGTLQRHVYGSVPLTIIAGANGEWYYNQKFAWGNQISYGFSGNAAWVQTTKGIESMEPDQLLDMKLLFDVQAPLKLKEFYPEMNIKGEEIIGDKKTIVIAAQTSSGVNTELVFDKETGFLIRAGDIFFEDYKEVNKIKRAFTILLGRDEGEEHRQMKMQFSEIKLNEAIDNSIFDLPSCVLSDVDPLLYKSRKYFKPSIEQMDKCIGIYQHSDKPEIKFRIFREDDHLFLDLVGRGLKIEIIPESEADYYTKFIGWDFHFNKNKSETVSELIISTSNSIIKAVRMN